MNRNELNKIENLAVRRVLDRNTANILEEDEQGIFVQDQWSGVFLLSCKNFETGKQWIAKHRDKNFELLFLCQDTLSDFAKDLLNIKIEGHCYQYGYFGNRFEEMDQYYEDDPDRPFFVRPAVLSDLEWICANYDISDEYEISKTIENGNMLIAQNHEGQRMGFVGEHLEGSTGMLLVLPEYRKLGIGIVLEKLQINRTIDRGFIPFGQVYLDNEVSINLQKKLGLEISQTKCSWLVKED